MLSKQFRAQSGTSNVEEILLELFWIGLIVDGGFVKCLSRDSNGFLPSSNNSVWVDFEFHESLGFTQKFRGKDGDRSSSIADFIVLDLGKLAQNLSGGVINTARSKDSGAIIGDLDAKRNFVWEKLTSGKLTLARRFRIDQLESKESCPYLVDRELT